MTKPVDDLPDALKAQLSKGPSHRPSGGAIFTQLQRVFANGPLSTDDILIAIYHDNGDVIKRVTLMSRLNYYIRGGHFRRVSVGMFALPE